uniref:Uncharacterized protein n=1 Tax=Rhizophora mucronata TaxID=61149 RepID=A0A2P2QXW1_RHIMU
MARPNTMLILARDQRTS